MASPINTKNAHIELPVTKDFLEEKILARLKIDAKLEAIGDYFRIDEGAGFLSYIICVPLTWDRKLPELPSSVVLKALTTLKFEELLANGNIGDDRAEAEQAKMQEAMGRHAHNTECAVYNYFIGHKPIFPIPFIYFAQEKTDEQQGIIIMQNLVNEAGCIDIFEGHSLESVQNMVDIIAEIQAFGLKHQDLVDRLPMMKREIIEPMFNRFQSMFKPIADQFPEEFSQFKMEDIKNMTNPDFMFETLFPGSKNFDVQLVLVQGDLWTNNVMVSKKDGKFTSEIAAVIDWQGTHGGCPGEDLARFFSSSMDGNLRRDHETELINRYYEKLSMSLGTKPPFSCDEVHKWYRRSFRIQALIPAMGFAMIGPIMGKSPEEVKAKIFNARFAIEDGLRFTAEEDQIN